MNESWVTPSPQCNLWILTNYVCFSHWGHLLHNLALKKTAVQSSNGDSIGLAIKAVDGNRDENYQKSSCTLTLPQSDPWWRVDLARVYTIGAVAITNIAGFENRLNGAEIWIGNSTNFSDPERVRWNSVIQTNIINLQSVIVPSISFLVHTQVCGHLSHSQRTDVLLSM